MLPTTGSGNMVPLPMAEFVQQNFADLGIKVEYEVADWNTVLTALRAPAGGPGAPARDAINHGLPISYPTQLFLNFHGSAVPPNGSNWSVYRDQEVNALLDEAFRTFDPEPHDALITRGHVRIVDDAPGIANPLSPFPSVMHRHLMALINEC